MKDEHDVYISREETYYDSVVERIRADFKTFDFWIALTQSLREYNEEFLLNTGYPLLLRDTQPKLLQKPFDSFLLKTYRKNVLDNKYWPKAPSNGWILPENWFSRVSDIIRTLIEVKYLDGVEFLIGRIESFSDERNIKCKSFLEAREKGYYAAHLYVTQTFEIPKKDWDTEKVDVSIEIQITTQLQEVIRQLLHRYYEDARVKPAKSDSKWQWDYKSEEFSANYLAHILHYVEGMIVDIREKQQGKEKIT